MTRRPAVVWGSTDAEAPREALALAVKGNLGPRWVIVMPVWVMGMYVGMVVAVMLMATAKRALLRATATLKDPGPDWTPDHF